MARKIILSTITVFILWTIIDFVVHGILLDNLYKETASLWRDPMNDTLLLASSLVAAFFFVYIYARFFREHSVSTGWKYGLYYGLAWATGMAFSTYAAMPIPLEMAWSWFFCVLAEAFLGGIVLGAIMKPGDTGVPPSGK
jgi:hypothetical protein